MQVDFIINWGYQYLYSRKHYHPVFVWDGNISVKNGKIENVYKLDYPYIWTGIPHSPKETRLSGMEWCDRTKREFSGIRVRADVTENAEFLLTTASGVFSFSAKDIIERKEIEFPVGPKYLGCYVTVYENGYHWFKAAPRENEIVFDADDLNADVREWGRGRYAWLNPGEKLDFVATIPESKADFTETVFHFEASGAKDYGVEKESVIYEYIPMELFCDGEKVLEFKHFFRAHDAFIMMLDDLWQRVRIAPGEHTFSIKNAHDGVCLLIGRISLIQSEKNHGQLSIPEWALKNEKIYGRVFATKKDNIKIFGAVNFALDCEFGWNEFEIQIDKAGVFEIQTASDKASVEIFDCEEEKNPIKVGYDLTQICHDDTGELDWILDYTQRTRLGNFALIRRLFLPIDEDKYGKLLYKWGDFCYKHGIYVAACNSYTDGNLARGAKEMFSNCGPHEYPGKVYARDPQEPYASENMKEASEKYIDFLKIKIDEAHKVCDTAAFGDASGGIRYSYLAGCDMVRAETMVPHTMTILSQARAASEALGKGRWGVHIAGQHAYFPYRRNHTSQYFLSMAQPWIMGAELIYEEDSLFGMWSEDRQAWGDTLVKEKRDLTRAFFKFAKTHPRKGKNIRNIGYIEGRYAAPFNGFICDREQTPDYSVWGAFGNDAPEWGHRQPEKARQILDVLMPGASTQPLRQKFEKRRFFFSGTPYGDFDCLPIESSAEYFGGYKLLLNLGWNTAIEEDYEKLKGYVENGGILLTGIPQFSKHIERKFLEDMKELDLYNGGDLSDFLGIEVIGRGQKYSGQWNSKGREKIKIPELSAMPSVDESEDGEAIIAEIKVKDAEIVAWDKASAAPLLVRRKLGKGCVYTLTAWAYPGHEKFREFSAAWVAYLAKTAMPEIYVLDETNEVFWTSWQDGDDTTVMLLNTDWTTPYNEKKVKLVVNEDKMDITVTERDIVRAVISSEGVKVEKFSF